MIAPRYRVGIIGFGNVGSQLYEVLNSDDRFEVAFVHARRRPALDEVPSEHWCADLADAESFAPDLVVEAAHPIYTVEHAQSILRTADYLPLSTTALVDDELRELLTITAESSGTRLLLPHGALIGLSSLIEVKDQLAEVSITFTKNPGSLPGDSDSDAPDREVLYEGPVRDIAEKFPRNVNSMVTLALATVGLDRCRGTLVSDRTTQHGQIDIEAVGTDGSRLRIQRWQPMVGVSGSEMFASTLGSVMVASGRMGAGVHFV